MNYKAKIRVATDMYEFIELEVDRPVDEIWSAYKELKSYTTKSQGIPDKEWNKAIDEYMNTGTLKDGIETYNKMSEKQQWFMQQLKKHGKRNGYAERKLEDNK